MWGKIIIPMYRLWLNGLYGLYGPRCPLSSKRPINLISLSLSRHMASLGLSELKISTFPLIIQHWDSAGSWNPSSCIVKNMAAAVWHKEPGNQQPHYWPIIPEYFFSLSPSRLIIDTHLSPNHWNIFPNNMISNWCYTQNIKSKTYQALVSRHLGPLLLTWINFNPSMDK